MKQFMSRNKKWLGYILYCIIVAVAFLYYRFPSDALRDYLQTRASNSSTPLLVSIGQIRPWLPFGLRFAQTHVSLKDKPAVKIFGAESLSVSAEPWSLLRGKSKYRFKCLAYGGKLRGCISFQENSMAAPFTAEIKLESIQIGTYAYLKDLIGRDVHGILSGTIYYSGQQKDPIGGTGEASLRLSDGRVELLFPVLSLRSIDFNEVTMDIGLQRQKINLSRLDLDGSQLKSALSGTIGLKKNLGNSTLDLEGTLEPRASLFKNVEGLSDTIRLLGKGPRQGTLTFIIYGTIRRPRIKFT